MTFSDQRSPPTRSYGQRIGFGCLGVLALLIASGGAYNYGSRYASWARLDKDRVLSAAGDYVRDHAPGQKVCLYAVACDGRRARLVLVKNIAAWNAEAVRQIAWDRRFRGTCEGYTANLGLAVVEGGLSDDDMNREAAWSFYNDGFVPTMPSNGPPLSFSETPAEPCTPEYAIAG